MRRIVQLSSLGLVLTLATAGNAVAQLTPAEQAARLVEPDYTLAALATGLRTPRHKAAVRITHRFAQPIDDAGAAGLFGIDSGAQVGLEFRFGLTEAADVGVHRTSDRTIEFFGRYGLARQASGMPLELTAFASIEGTDNFGASGSSPASFSPALSLVAARLVGSRAALYVEPAWVHHANIFERDSVSERDTFMIGLGARVRVLSTVYVVGEYVPRVAGYTTHRDQASVAVEKRVGGHVFQLNVSDALGTTLGQIARGDVGVEGWHLGFNISRKF
jgi:hypothetical protein